jgi:hypothetical protein
VKHRIKEDTSLLTRLAEGDFLSTQTKTPQLMQKVDAVVKHLCETGNRDKAVKLVRKSQVLNNYGPYNLAEINWFCNRYGVPKHPITQKHYSWSSLKFYLLLFVLSFFLLISHSWERSKVYNF